MTKAEIAGNYTITEVLTVNGQERIVTEDHGVTRFWTGKGNLFICILRMEGA
jgi:hypothetical protein